MLLFGHAGITLAAAVLVGDAVRAYRTDRSNQSAQNDASHASRNESSGWWERYIVPDNFIDIRVLMVGALLPDIIDKPIGRLFFSDEIGSGRMFSHTLVFFLMLFLAGLYLNRVRGHSWLLILSAGVFSHLVLDGVWLVPETFFWPLYGWSFPRDTDAGFWTEILSGLLMPEVLVPEVLGLIAVSVFGVTLLRRHTVWRFLRHGSTTKTLS